MGFRSLAPTMLLAAPRLGDPHFDKSLVLLARHEKEGALGWIVNGGAVAPVRDLFKLAGMLPQGRSMPATDSFQRLARWGGPVSPQTGWLLFRPVHVDLPGAIMELSPDVNATGDPQTLGAVLRGGEPREFRLLLGYAGWAPGQLESELKEGAWLPTAVDPALVFSEHLEKVYDEALKAATGGADMLGFQGWGRA